MSNSCVYVLKKGKNKGDQCGSKCLEHTQYCKKHSKDTNEEQSPPRHETPLRQESSQNIEPSNTTESTIVKQKDEKPKKEPVGKTTSKSKEKKQKDEKPKKEPVGRNTSKSKEKTKSPEKETSIKVEVYERKKISTTRNIHGNFVLENNLIVHPVNKKIIGRQEGDKIIEISIEDIEYCKEHGFCYEQPSVMYFRNSDIEKEEMKLQKQLLKSKNLEQDSKINENKNSDSEEELDDDVSENEDSEAENDE